MLDMVASFLVLGCGRLINSMLLQVKGERVR
jgi:hypothetical protein